MLGRVIGWLKWLVVLPPVALLSKISSCHCSATWVKCQYISSLTKSHASDMPHLRSGFKKIHPSHTITKCCVVTKVTLWFNTECPCDTWAWPAWYWNRALSLLYPSAMRRYHGCIMIRPDVSTVQHYRFWPTCDEQLSLLYYDKTGETGTEQGIVL